MSFSIPLPISQSESGTPPEKELSAPPSRLQSIASAQFEQIPILKIADMDAVVSPGMSPLMEESPYVSSIFSPDTLSPAQSASSLLLESPPSGMGSRVGSSAMLVPDSGKKLSVLVRDDSEASLGMQQSASASPTPSDSDRLEFTTTLSPPNLDESDEEEEQDPEDRKQFEEWMASMKRVREATLKKKRGEPGGSSPSSPLPRTGFTVVEQGAAGPSQLGGQSQPTGQSPPEASQSANF
jgi:hypothetical protein